jgi:hypothetical protein
MENTTELVCNNYADIIDGASDAEDEAGLMIYAMTTIDAMAFALKGCAVGAFTAAAVASAITSSMMTAVTAIVGTKVTDTRMMLAATVITAAATCLSTL